MNNRNNKKGNNNKKPFKQNFKKQTNVEHVFIQDISSDSFKKRVLVKGKIDRVVQTGGPTVFVMTDGTGTLSLKGFIKPGERAYPEIDEGDTVKATITIEEFNGEIEGDISSMIKLSENEANELKEKISEIERERAEVDFKGFMVNSPILEKLKDSFINAATEIRLAVIQNRPIIIRHHNDTDGYSSGFALERAILPLIQRQHGTAKAGWEFLTRAPCSAPFYEIDDSIRDTANSLRNVAKFSNKMPLIIIADNGSSPEDLFAIQQGKVHGMDFIVIDHHFFDKDVISDEVLSHINPFLVGENGSAFSAGMLCSELGKIINPEVENIKQIPAMAGYADRIDIINPDVMEKYLKIAEGEGYSKELLSNISNVIEYVSAKLRFMEAREYIEVLFGEPRTQQGKLVNLMAPYIKKLDSQGLEMAKANAKIEKIGNVNLQMVDIGAAFPGFGFFPKPGRCIGMVHDSAMTENKMDKLVTAGIMGTAITLRATDAANFSVHDLINYIDKELPHSFVNGGGHKNAGSINFVPSVKDEVVELMKTFISKR